MIEMAVGLVLFTIMSATVASAITTMLANKTTDRVYSYNQVIMNNVLDQMRRDLQYAKDIYMPYSSSYFEYIIFKTSQPNAAGGSTPERIVLYLVYDFSNDYRFLARYEYTENWNYLGSNFFGAYSPWASNTALSVGGGNAVVFKIRCGSFASTQYNVANKTGTCFRGYNNSGNPAIGNRPSWWGGAGGTYEPNNAISRLQINTLVVYPLVNNDTNKYTDSVSQKYRHIPYYTHASESYAILPDTPYG